MKEKQVKESSKLFFYTVLALYDIDIQDRTNSEILKVLR